MCEQVKEIGLNYAETLMSQPIEASLVPGSQELALIANTPSPEADIHSVAFYGEEFDKNDMAIRFLYSVTKNPNTYPTMQADQMDDEAIKDYNNHYNNYFTNYNNSLEIAKKFPLGNFYNGAYFSQADLYDLAYKWKDGTDWLSSLNNRWKWIIGALDVAQSNDKFCQCICKYEEMSVNGNGYSFEVDYPADCGVPNACDIWKNNPYYNVTCSYEEEVTYELVNYASDGLVVNQSAMALPNAKYQSRKMIGSGHFQMRNDSELKKALNLLYNTSILGTDYFNLKD